MSQQLIRDIKLEIRANEKKLTALRKALSALEDSEGNGDTATDGIKVRRGRRGSWKPKVVTHLTEHGPTLRKDLLVKLAIKPGTLDSVLNDDAVFEQDSLGRWQLKKDQKTNP